MCGPRSNRETSTVAILSGATFMTPFIMAILALGIVSVACWRLIVGMVAGRPVGDRLRYAIGPAARLKQEFSGSDFPLLERLFAAAGALGSPGRATTAIRAYYRIVHGLGVRLPFLARWSHREMNVCSRYLAARIERLLASNAACSRHAQFP
jgi:hypothetical protein